ncbi:hypothetical protein BG846_02153 [Streptomyces fradiae ATCC 10745 = DSM 40063]|uniref:Uncharacterized protein n=1 Tax=Streptomyces fradiae ATCC 10745 = DSM 40063 TaxID=1319510 RepID=A0A1Y2NXG7_STRFR|nr:hypothetical protein BG846_02153 [Streptomyces fradiae ATCC 10745 = DSM 40063]
MSPRVISAPPARSAGRVPTASTASPAARPAKPTVRAVAYGMRRIRPDASGWTTMTRVKQSSSTRL